MIAFAVVSFAPRPNVSLAGYNIKAIVDTSASSNFLYVSSRHGEEHLVLP
jgi:hypothetical protein